MRDVRYITQITREDLREIRGMVEASNGPGIVIDRLSGGVRISISTDQLKHMIYAFCRQAWPSACPAISADAIDAIDLGANV